MTIDLRTFELAMAYEHAAGIIDGCCVTRVLPEDETWLDLKSSESDLSDEVAYLDSRRLLLHHPEHPHLVRICDEDEPVGEAATEPAIDPTVRELYDELLGVTEFFLDSQLGEPDESDLSRVTALQLFEEHFGLPTSRVVEEYSAAPAPAPAAALPNAEDLSYDLATKLIRSECIALVLPGKEEWINLASSEHGFTPGPQLLTDAITYLDSRRLLLHHPKHPHLVRICDEDEPVPAPADAGSEAR